MQWQVQGNKPKSRYHLTWMQKYTLSWDHLHCKYLIWSVHGDKLKYFATVPPTVFLAIVLPLMFTLALSMRVWSVLVAMSRAVTCHVSRVHGADGDVTTAGPEVGCWGRGGHENTEARRHQRPEASSHMPAVPQTRSTWLVNLQLGGEFSGTPVHYTVSSQQSYTQTTS